MSEAKAGGATYTPKILADFVAREMVEAALDLLDNKNPRVLDPAVGEGELLLSLLERLRNVEMFDIEVHGFETDPESLRVAKRRLQKRFREASVRFESRSFLEFLDDGFQEEQNLNLFRASRPERYDLIIANPPYVRTQVISAPRHSSLQGSSI